MKKIDFTSLFLEIPITGECEMHIDKVVQSWDKDFFISQWHDTFRLCHKSGLKVTISREQAKELIVQLYLSVVHSDVFKNGKTWRTLK